MKLILISKSSHSRWCSTVPSGPKSASNVGELLPLFSPSTHGQHSQQTFLQGKNMLTISHVINYLMCEYLNNWKLYKTNITLRFCRSMMSSRHTSPIRLCGVSSVSRLQGLWEHSAPTKIQQVCFCRIDNIKLCFCTSFAEVFVFLLNILAHRYTK